MGLIGFVLIAAGLSLGYVMIVRPWLQTLTPLAPAFAAEASVAQKWRARVTGWKTKIMARLVVISGLLVGLYDQALPFIAGQNWTPLTDMVPAWSLPVGMVLLGIVFDYLRKATANPPHVITQKVDGQAMVVDVVQPAQG
jgi:hypothetical protein